MLKNRIVYILMSALMFQNSMIDVECRQTPLEAESKIECVEKVDFKNPKTKQVVEQGKVELKKRKEIEDREQEELRISEGERLKAEEDIAKQPNFNPYDVTEESNLTKEQLYKMLNGTSLITLVDALHWYEQEYKINSIFIASIIALESSWGRSSLSISHNNLTGYIGRNGDYYYFSDWGESIQETFRLISEEYTNENGLFYNGKSIWNINQKYCELDSWTDKVNNIGYELLNKVNN